MDLIVWHKPVNQIDRKREGKNDLHLEIGETEIRRQMLDKNIHVSHFMTMNMNQHTPTPNRK